MISWMGGVYVDNRRPHIIFGLIFQEFLNEQKLGHSGAPPLMGENFPGKDCLSWEPVTKLFVCQFICVFLRCD